MTKHRSHDMRSRDNNRLSLKRVKQYELRTFNSYLLFVSSKSLQILDIKLGGTILDRDLPSREEDDVTANVKLFSLKAICISRNYLFVETLNFATVY